MQLCTRGSVCGSQCSISLVSFVVSVETSATQRVRITRFKLAAAERTYISSTGKCACNSSSVWSAAGFGKRRGCTECSCDSCSVESARGTAEFQQWTTSRLGMTTLRTYAAGELGGAHSPAVTVDGFRGLLLSRRHPCGEPLTTHWRDLLTSPGLSSHGIATPSSLTTGVWFKNAHPPTHGGHDHPAPKFKVASCVAASAGRAGSANDHPCRQQLGPAMSTLNVGGRGGAKFLVAHLGDGFL